MLKKCAKCGQILPLSMFTGKGTYCKTCSRDYAWQYRYGISPEQYYELYQKQGGKCKICGAEVFEGKYLCIDHNKETGEVRGLLCRECNVGLGMFKDSPDIIKKALKYLKENK